MHVVTREKGEGDAEPLLTFSASTLQLSSEAEARVTRPNADMSFASSVEPLGSVESNPCHAFMHMGWL